MERLTFPRLRARGFTLLEVALILMIIGMMMLMIVGYLMAPKHKDKHQHVDPRKQSSSSATPEPAATPVPNATPARTIEVAPGDTPAPR